MSPGGLFLLAAILFVLLSTKNIFWVIVAALVLLAYSLAFTARTTFRGVKHARNKARDVYVGEIGAMDKVTGKYPANFFDSVGKGASEKLAEHLTPKGAKSYADAQNYKWSITKPAEKAGEVASKILDSLAKLFGK